MAHIHTEQLIPRTKVVAFATLLVATVAGPAMAVTIPTVPVGNAGNAPSSYGLHLGAVAYDYRIGTTEVTNAQYAEFLNAKAASDPLNLFNGGIARSGTAGNYTYTTIANTADKPTNLVTWYDAIRFANWMHNGQGDGDTETGAYTLEGGTPTPTNSLTITRNAGATWCLPSQDEWYKAAYYDPESQGGGTDGYWAFATGSNIAPTKATIDSLGNISNPGLNVANYDNLGGQLSTVGSAGPLSASFYGTYDQGGNAWEWNDTFYRGGNRGFMGGGYSSIELTLNSQSDPISTFPSLMSIDNGFRVAFVPEPSSAVLALFGCAFIWVLRKRIK